VAGVIAITVVRFGTCGRFAPPSARARPGPVPVCPCPRASPCDRRLE
jgi:hypothetical protein